MVAQGKTEMDLTTSQLCLLRSLLKQGCPDSLMGTFLLRCGTSTQEWTALGDEGLVQKDKANRWAVTEKGKKTFRVVRKGRWF